MRVHIEDVTGIINVIFAPSHHKEAKAIIEFAIELYKEAGYDTRQIEDVMLLLEEVNFTIQ